MTVEIRGFLSREEVFKILIKYLAKNGFSIHAMYEHLGVDTLDRIEFIANHEEKEEII